jgi:hypothetical protein
MNARQAISEILYQDPSVYSIVGENIFHLLLDENFADFPAIVYSARIDNTINTINDRDLGRYYLASIKCVSRDPADFDPLQDYVIHAFLSDSSTTLYFDDISFERDIEIYDPDNDLHTLSLDFTVTKLSDI